MVIKADQQKIKTLLKDTITLLCKNGLEYNAEFCIEALIGITLDKNDVFLVNINETVKSLVDSSPVAPVAVESAASPDRYPSSSQVIARNRKRSHSVVTKTASTGDTGVGGGSSYDDLQNAHSRSEESSPKAKVPKLKQEDLENEEIEDQDTIIIKEEVEEWAVTGSNSSYCDYPNADSRVDPSANHDSDLQQALQTESLLPFSEGFQDESSSPDMVSSGLLGSAAGEDSQQTAVSLHLLIFRQNSSCKALHWQNPDL